MRITKLAALALVSASLGLATARAEDPAPPATGPPAAQAVPADRTQATPVWRFLEAAPDGRVIGFAEGNFSTPADHLFVARSDYWLGLGCTPLPPPVRAHVDVPEGQGLLVHGVAPESPAAEAGVEQFDILLSYGEAPVANLAELVEAVDARGAEETTLTLIRGGEQISLNVTPVERDEAAASTGHVFRVAPLAAAGAPAEGPVQMRLIHPPMITRTSGLLLPEGVQIQITKSSEEPAEIRVTRGEESWDVTEDDLSPLPDDLRPAIERMLHPVATATLQAQPLTLHMRAQPAEGGRVIVMPAPSVRATPLQPAMPAGEASPLDDSVRFQLEQIQRQLDELRRTLEASAAE